jgi:hypothetical protein
MLQDEDDLCEFPLCREVPIEQDSIEYLGKTTNSNNWQFFKNFTSDEVVTW